jgi:hypothetical protein
MQPSTLLHPFPTAEGSVTTITVEPLGPRRFRLDPYPFDQPKFTCTVPARYVPGRLFSSHKELADKFSSAPVELLTIAITA